MNAGGPDSAGGTGGVDAGPDAEGMPDEAAGPEPPAGHYGRNRVQMPKKGIAGAKDGDVKKLRPKE